METASKKFSDLWDESHAVTVNIIKEFRMNKKKKITLIWVSILSFVIIVALLVAGTVLPDRLTYFSKSVLEDHLVPQLPRISGKNREKQYGKILRLETSEENFEKYVNEVYEYLLSCNFAYLGYRGDVLSTFFGGMPTYEFCVGKELSDYRYDFSSMGLRSEGYVFVWADELHDDGHDLKSHFLEIRRSTASGQTYLELCFSFESYRLVS